MKRTKRFIAWLVLIAMLLSGCSTAASAEGNSEGISASLTEEIAATLAAQETPGEWMIFDLAAYGAEIPEAKRTAYIESVTAAVSNANAVATDFAKAEIILRALGVDTTALEGVSVPEKIHAIEELATYSDAVWILISDSLDSVTLTDEQISAAIAKISENTSEEGLLTGSYGGYTYDDPDSTGAAVGALSAYVDETDTYGANELYNKMLTALSNAQQESGSYGSACTDAFVIIGLCAAGIDPNTDERFVKGENSLVDGLMSYAIAGGFAGYDGSLDLAWSTEQGFRALIALDGFEKSEGAAYNIYYSGNSDAPEDGEEEETEEPSSGGGGLIGGEVKPEPEEQPETPDNEPAPEPEDTSITVTFEMRTHKKTWISSHKVKVPENTSVKNLISQVFDEYGVESSGLSMGYLRSVTYNGETWGEFDAGAASGWQYFVNGELPRVGISSYKLRDGDSVELVYTADYTESQTPPSETAPEKEDEEPVQEEEKVWTNPFSDVSADAWFISAVQFVHERGLMKGMTESTFVPNATLTRAMFVTVLYRMEKEPEAGAEAFSDVDENAWYGAAVAWASEKGIVNGTGAETFSPDMPVTREQMAALAYRYASYKNGETAQGSAEFSDSEDISEYAKEAAAWAQSVGVMTGANGKFNPAANAVRSESAAVFMRLYNVING